MAVATQSKALEDLRRAAGTLASAERLLKAGNPELGVRVAYGVVVGAAKTLLEHRGNPSNDIAQGLMSVAPGEALATYRRLSEYMRWLDLDRGVGSREAREFLKEAREFLGQVAKEIFT